MNTIDSTSYLSNRPISFKSRQNPIKAFKIASKFGDINISEINYDNELNLTMIKRLSNFFSENFSRQTTYYEPLIKIRSGTPAERIRYQKEFDEFYEDIFANENNRNNLTMLIGTDKKNNIVAACLSYGFHHLPRCKETTLYIDSIAVSPKLRGLNLAKTMLNKIFDAHKNSFTDIFLGSTPPATKFYEKLGFEEMTRNDPAQNTVLRRLDELTDYMDCMVPYTKPLQKAKPRWYIACANAIEKDRVCLNNSRELH